MTLRWGQFEPNWVCGKPLVAGGYCLAYNLGGRTHCKECRRAQDPEKEQAEHLRNAQREREARERHEAYLASLWPARLRRFFRRFFHGQASK